MDKKRAVLALIYFATFFTLLFWVVGFSEELGVARIANGLSGVVAIAYFLILIFVVQKNGIDILKHPVAKKIFIILVFISLCLLGALYAVGLKYAALFPGILLFCNPIVARYSLLFPFLALFGS